MLTLQEFFPYLVTRMPIARHIHKHRHACMCTCLHAMRNLTSPREHTSQGNSPVRLPVMKTTVENLK